jgi:hypothetical protein
MMRLGPIVYALFGAGSLVFWAGASVAGYEPAGPAYRLPPSVRQSPGGYRSFHFWHSGYQLGK